MDLETFEQLWRSRDQVDGDTRAELERMVQSNPQCAAFAEGGDWVRDMLQDMGELKAPADFSYRMRVYAANHPETEDPTPSRGWLRWPVVTVGAAAGVTAMFMAFGPLVEGDMRTLGLVGAENTPEVRAASTPAVDSDQLAESADSTRTDSSRSITSQPDWDMRTVGTAGNQ